MTFDDLPAGVPLFVDANTFVYSFGKDPIHGAACTALLTRIEHKEFTGYTSADILGEVAHRMMTIEAGPLFGWPAQGMANRLRRHPAEVQQLGLYKQALDEIKATGIQVVDVTRDLVFRAADFSAQYGLLTGDALVLAVMEGRHLTHLASNDADFDRVPRVVRYAPA